jgi:hypothetical protein
MVDSPPRNYKFPPNDSQIDKGKKHAISPSSEASQCSFIYSKQQSAKADIDKRGINFSGSTLQ